MVEFLKRLADIKEGYPFRDISRLAGNEWEAKPVLWTGRFAQRPSKWQAPCSLGMDDNHSHCSRGRKQNPNHTFLQFVLSYIVKDFAVMASTK